MNFNDPVNNFTSPVTQPGGMRIPEFAVRQLIGWALGKIRETLGTPQDVVEQLFPLVPKETRDQFRTWLGDNKNIFLDVSFPREGTHLSLIVVEPAAEAEATELAFLNDSVGTTDRGGHDTPPTEASAYAIPENYNTNIYIGSDDDRLTLLLYQTVKFIIVSNKQSLTKFYDMHNLSLSGGVLDHDAEKLPQFVYYRVLQMKYLTLFDYNGPASGPAVVNLILNVEAAIGGAEAIIGDVEDNG